MMLGGGDDTVRRSDELCAGLFFPAARRHNGFAMLRSGDPRAQGNMHMLRCCADGNRSSPSPFRGGFALDGGPLLPLAWPDCGLGVISAFSARRVCFIGYIVLGRTVCLSAAAVKRLNLGIFSDILSVGALARLNTVADNAVTSS